MVQGEGAAVFVFEDCDHARARGATILAEVIGFAMTSDATDIVTPNQQGAARAMRGALRDAGLAPEDDRLHQRPRHRHRRQRQDRVRRGPRASSAPMPTG